MSVKHLDHLNMTVSNLDESKDWYKRVFGFEEVESGLRNGLKWAILKSGEAMLCIYEYVDLAGPHDWTKPDRHTINHFGLRITDRRKWEETLKRENLSVLYGGEVSWNNSSSWYLHDPTGHEIEVALWDDDCVKFLNQ